MNVPSSGSRTMTSIQPALAQPLWSRRAKLSMNAQMTVNTTRNHMAKMQMVQNIPSSGKSYANMVDPLSLCVRVSDAQLRTPWVVHVHGRTGAGRGHPPEGV